MTETKSSESEAPQMLNAYYSPMPSCQIIDGAGNSMIFVNHRFVTKDPARIAFLDKMIADGSTGVYAKPDQLQISEADLDPMAALKAQFYAQFMAEQAAHQNPEQDLGETKVERLNPASTTDIAPVTLSAGNSNTAALIARAANAAHTTAAHK